MATGFNPLARRVAWLLLLAFPVSQVGLEEAARAQDAAALLREGLQQVRAGQTEQGIDTLRRALAADPSSEEILSALGRAEYAALLGVMASGQEGANVVHELLRRAAPELPAQAFNEQELDRLVQAAVTSEDDSERFAAAIELSRTYGEFAVPGLVRYLGSGNTEHRVNAHVTLIRRIGADAVLPLVAALDSDNADVRGWIVDELGVIGDERALGTVAQIAQNEENETVRNKAAKALGSLSQRFPYAAGQNAAQLHTRLARMYYGGDYRVMSYTDRPVVVWRWEGEGLNGVSVPRHLYTLKLAEEEAYDALHLDPNNVAARALLARILTAEYLSAAAVSQAQSGMAMAAAAGAPGTVMSLGWDTLAQALRDCLDEQDTEVAAALLQVMPWVYTESDFTHDNPVVEAAGSSSNAVGYAAAEAVLRFNGFRRITSYPDPDGLLSLVARAAGEIVPRQVLVIDADDARRNKTLSALADAGYIVFGARSGSDGYVRAIRYAGLDLIVASSNLGDMETLGLIARLSEDERTANVPILLIGSEEQAAEDAWRGIYEGKVKAIASVPSGPGLPTEAFLGAVQGSFSGSADEHGRYRYSAQVLDALATTDTRNTLFNWRSLTEMLVNTLNSEAPVDPPVKPNAIRALGNIGDQAATEPLAAFFGGDADEGLRAAAGMALLSIFRHDGVSLSDQAFEHLLSGTQAGGEVAKAAFAALGAAKLSPAQSLRVVMTNRPAVDEAPLGVQAQDIEEDD